MLSETLGTESAPIVTFEQGEDCTKIISIDGRLEFVGHIGKPNLHSNRPDPEIGTLWFESWPEQARPLVREKFFATLSGEKQEFLADCETLAGHVRRWRVTLEPRLAPNGMVVSVLSRSTEIAC